MSFQNCRLFGRDIDPDAYHRENEERGHPNFAMSPSALKLFWQCPARWMAGYREPSSKWMQWGNLVDTALLTPNDFKAKYVTQPEFYTATKDSFYILKGKKVAIKKGDSLRWNNRTDCCKEWNEEQESKGFTVIDRDTLAAVQQAVDRLRKDADIFNFLDASHRQTMIVGEWHDKLTGITIPVRCLIDLEPRAEAVSEIGVSLGNCLGDMKTAGCAATQPFARIVHRFGYDVQGAFDLDLYNAATGERRDTWCLIVQESRFPFQPSKKMLSQEFIELGRQKYQKALSLYCRCIKTGHWPGYDDSPTAIQGWSVLHPEPFMEYEEKFADEMQPEEEETPEMEGELIP